MSSNGYPFDVSPTAFGELRDSNGLIGNPEALRERMKEDGFLLLRGFLGRERVLAARQELLGKLNSVGLMDRRHPVMDGIYSGDNSVWERSTAEFTPENYAPDGLSAMSCIAVS